MKPLPTARRSRQLGLTLAELVVTIVLMGILSAAAMIKITSRTQHSVTAQADELRRNISHLQLLAISEGTRLQLSVGTTGYIVCAASATTCDAAHAIADPSTGASFNVTLTDGASFTTGANTTYYFDSYGRPVSNTGNPVSLLTASYVLGMNGVGRSNDVTITVSPISGFATTGY